LAAVWTQRPDRASIVLDFAGVAGGLYAVLRGKETRRAALAAAGAAIATLGLVILHRVQPATTAADLVTRPFDAAPNALAATSWAQYILSTPALTVPEFAPQIVAWTGLFAMLVCAVGNLLRQTDADRGDGDLRARFAVKL